ncbi:hypothetical protein Tco_0613426 [Tanacetum coccineum]
MRAICNADAPVDFQAPRTSSDTEKKDSQGSEPEAKTGLRRKQSSKYTSESKLEATKTSTPVVVEMHKEAQQATNDPKSLEVTNKEGADPQLSSVISASNLHKLIYSACFIIHSESALGRDASADSTAEADPGNSAPYDSLPQQQVDFMDLDSLEDDPNIVVDESEEDDEEVHATSNVETEDTSAPKPLSLRSIQFQELTNQVLIL